MTDLTLTLAQQKCLLAVGKTLGSVGRTRIVDVAGVLYPPRERTDKSQHNGLANSSYHRNTAKMLERLVELGLVWVAFGVGSSRWYELTDRGRQVLGEIVQ